MGDHFKEDDKKGQNHICIINRFSFSCIQLSPSLIAILPDKNKVE